MACNDSGTSGPAAAGATGITEGTAGATSAAGSTEGIPTAGNSAGTNANIGGSGENSQAGGNGEAPGSAGTDTGTAGAQAGVGGAGGAAQAGVGGAAGTAQAGVGGTAGTADAGVGGTADTTGGKSRFTHHTDDQGEGDGQDVVTIGDSWMNITTNLGGIEGGLDRVTGKVYRHYAVAATTVLSGVIPGQYSTAKRINPDIKTVIMTGGGNDVIMDMTLTADCMASGDRCRQRLLDVMERLAELWTEMNEDGVRDVFVVNYAEGAGTGVGNIDVRQEYMERIEQIPPPIVMHFIETTDIVNGRLADGIHPTSQACTEIAQAVYDHMIEAGARR